MPTNTVIEKTPAQTARCNLPLTSIATPFDWPQALADMTGANGTINICHRHLPHDGQRTAIRFIGRNWPKDATAVQDISYAELAALSNRFANGLRSPGVQQGDVVFALSPRIADLYTAVLGTLRLGAVFSPLFSAFGPEPIVARMSKGNGKVVLAENCEIGGIAIRRGWLSMFR